MYTRPVHGSIRSSDSHFHFHIINPNIHVSYNQIELCIIVQPILAATRRVSSNYNSSRTNLNGEIHTQPTITKTEEQSIMFHTFVTAAVRLAPHIALVVLLWQLAANVLQTIAPVVVVCTIM